MKSLSSTAPQETTYNLDDWQRGYESQPQEYDYWIDEIEGEIPASLQGTLFRNGPGLLDVGHQPLSHPFDGDGMICAISIKDGRAHFRNRFVRTEGYVAEQKLGKILYRGFGTQKPGGWLNNIFDLKFKNVANTSVICWDGKLWAMWEGGEPYCMDPSTLETVGLDRLGGILQPKQPFSAHPVITKDKDGQPVLVNFGVKLGIETVLSVFEIDKNQNLLTTASHKLKGFAFIHDCLVTPNYYIFVNSPFAIDALPFLLGQRSISECMRFDADKPTQIILMSRDDDHAVHTLETDSFFTFHHANAWEADGSIFLDSICYQSYPNIEAREDFRTLEHVEFPEGKLWRFQINPPPPPPPPLNDQTVDHQVKEHRICDMPSIHPDVVGLPYRYLYLGVADKLGQNSPMQAVLKIDWRTDERHLWSAAPRGFVCEPVFVPKPDPTEEDDGWLLTVVYDAAEHRSNLVILDARDLEAGPVTCLHLEHHIPHSFHGSWVSECYSAESSE